MADAKSPGAEGPPELFFGLVGALGTDLEGCTSSVKELLASLGYETHVIRLSSLLSTVPGFQGRLVKQPLDAFIRSHQEVGNRLREKLGQGDALARIAVAEVRRFRRSPNPSSL